MEFRAKPGPRFLLYLLVAGVVVAIGFGVSASVFPPRLGYVVEADRIVVEAGVSAFDHGFAIERARLTGARAVTLGNGWKRTGSDAAGLCAGEWEYEDLGRVRQATSCQSEAVLLEAGAERYVIAPADREAFLAAVAPGGATTGGAAAAGAAPIPFAPVPTPTVTRFIPLVVIGVVVVLPLLRKILRRLTYTVADGVLTVPAHLAPVKVPLAGATLKPGRIAGIRLAGTSGPGLHLGTFRDSVGTYHAAASVWDGVWVTGEKRVFVSPEDVEAFTAACVANGAVREG